MTTLYYGKLTPTSFAGSTVQAGYPISNLGLEAIGRNVRFADNTAGHFGTINLAAAQMVKAIVLHDVNFAACEVWKSADGVSFTFVGLFTSYAGRHGRRRGLVVINDANVKAVKFIITASGTTTDGAAYWRAGAAYLFGSSAALGVDPVYPMTVKTKRPRITTNIPNGITSVASTGLNVDGIQLNFMRKATESLDLLIQQTTAATCALDMGLATYPDQVWPVRMLIEDLDENFAKKTYSTLSPVLTEVVATS